VPVEDYPSRLEPPDQNVAIWRFMNMEKILDLITTSELYFCRADVFEDKNEGLPLLLSSL
jgi:hypothetical protein